MTGLPEEGLAYTLARVGRRKDPYADRRSFAQRLLAQGMDTSPVQSPWQGAARLAQAISGGLLSREADADEASAAKDRNTKLAEVMAEKDPQKKIGLLTAIDPEYGARLSGQMAVEQAKIDRQREGLQTAAGSFGASYGAPQITQGTLAPSGGTGNAGQAIAGIESGGRYDAVGPVANDKGNRAYGKYQVLDSNIGPWTQEVLGRPMTPQEFLANPQAQDAVFQAKFGQYQQKYGSPQAASRAWFAGEGGMNNSNAADVNGMTVQGYGNKFAQAYGPGAGGSAPPAPPVTVQATPPGMPQPLQIDMRGPGGMPQGSADGRPPAPSPQGLQAPVMTAQAPPQAPAIPDVPRPQPSPQQIQQYQQRLATGEFGNDGSAVNRARAALEAELDRDWGVQRDRAKMQFQQQTTDFADQRRTQREVEREANKPMNDTQALAATYADRMAEANAVVGTLPASVQTAGEGKIVGSIPFVGDYLANQVRSSEFQRYQQAKDNFIYSQLRKESGAVIGKDEYTAADRQYFPQPGDSKEVIAQKEVNRQIAIDGMIRSAGQTYRPAQARSSNPPVGGGQRQRISLDGKPL